ncbi:hypothetical protein [Yoonia maritima]|nr:hypothetical protein [Yoonia maritima]
MRLSYPYLCVMEKRDGGKNRRRATGVMGREAAHDGTSIYCQDWISSS